jgi:hypothetical protein
MVKKTLFITLSASFLNLTSAAFLFAGEFTASVRNTQVHLGENFTLNLTLKDTSPKEAPAVSELKDNFTIQSQQHLTHTSIVNGQFSTSIVWKISLTPLKEGLLQIPAITVDTTEGTLSTQPLTLNVSSAPSPKKDDNGLNIITKVSNANPYKNEPVIYTVLLTAKTPLYNVQMQKMQVEDAIIELIKEPKLEERVIDGSRFNVVEFSYLITPLKPSSLTIPSITIQGAIPQKRKDRYSSSLDDDFDSFPIMQGFSRLQPFSLMSEELQLDVQPAIAEISPWLPAKALSLEEVWSDNQELHAGEPFSRSFLIKAEGLKASQLPRLENLQGQNSLFKVYADKPTEQETLVQDSIHSSRQEQYTLIPQQAGSWLLPEISLSWWDTDKKEAKKATIPARSVQILPALPSTNLIAFETHSSADKTTTTTEASPSTSSFLLLSIIGVLTFLLTATLFWVYLLQRKIKSLTAKPSQKPINLQAAPPKKPIPTSAAAIQQERKEKLPNLNPT